MYSCYDPDSLFLPHVENIFADSCVKAGTRQGWSTDMSKDWFHMNLEEHLEETMVFPMIYGYLWYFPSTQFREHLGGQLHVLGLMLAPAPMPLGGCFRGSAIQLSPPWGMIPWYHDFAGAHWTMNCFVQVSICDLNLLETPYQSISAIISDGKDLHLPPRLQKCVPCQQPLGQDLSFDIRKHPAGSGSLMKWRVWPCPDLLLCFFFKDTRRDSHVFQSFWWNEPIIPGGYPPPNLSLFSLPPRFWNEHGNTIVFTF